MHFFDEENMMKISQKSNPMSRNVAGAMDYGCLVGHISAGPRGKPA